MSTIVTLNGSPYVIPATGEVSWGNNVSSYLIAISAGVLQKTGGVFTLSAETDFGNSFGLKTLYLKSETVNPATTGIIRLANNSDSISFRNAANSANIPLIVNASDQLTFNGVPLANAVALTPNRSVISDGSGFLSVSTVTSAEVAALHALTASRALTSDGSGLVAVSAVTATELGYVSGVTSSIQTQINALSAGGTSGVPEWSSSTTYAVGNYVRKTGTSELYASLTNNNLNHVLPSQTNNTDWQYIQTGNPTGSLLDFAGSSAPDGYLLCDGTAVSRTTYANLFAVIGIVYGSGDGSTTFNVPDSRSRVLAGKAASGTFGTLGATPGAETHSQTQTAHSHTVNSHTHTIAHRHPSPVSGETPALIGNGRTDGAGWAFGSTTLATQQVGQIAATATGTNTIFLNTGDSSAANSGAAAPGTDSQTPAISDGSSIQPTLVVNKIIKF